MTKKGYVKRKKEGRSYVYQATYHEHKASSNMLRDVIDRLFGGSTAAVMQHLLETDDLDEARGHVREMLAALAALREVFAPPEGVPALRHARACIDSTTTQVTSAQLQAFQKVESLRYGVFMPPPG